jgi:hypothetical protein
LLDPFAEEVESLRDRAVGGLMEQDEKIADEVGAVDSLGPAGASPGEDNIQEFKTGGGLEERVCGQLATKA